MLKGVHSQKKLFVVIYIGFVIHKNFYKTNSADLSIQGFEHDENFLSLFVGCMADHVNNGLLICAYSRNQDKEFTTRYTIAVIPDYTLRILYFDNLRAVCV